MVKIYSKALDQSIDIERLIGYHKGNQPGPTLIFFGGIHGNEPAGVFALKKVFENLEVLKIPMSGNMYGISGNLWALKNGVRYKKEDLNRLWTNDNIKDLYTNKPHPDNEDSIQQLDIYNTLKNILDVEKGPFYFFDLHTTSSQTIPFLTVNDSMLNRRFTMQYPIRMILGIEEYLDGPLLSYINEHGYVSFGFEAGQHDDPNSVKNHISFTYLSMVFAGCIHKNDVDFDKHYEFLNSTLKKSHKTYEIFYLHKIRKGERFSMKTGFINFQKINKGQSLAISDGKSVIAKSKGRVFMPLYQDKGDDGFFIIKKTPYFFMYLSTILRKIRFDHILPTLPGIHWISDKKDSLIVNLKVARFFTKQFFHLLGYRSKEIDKTHLIIKNRETASRKEDYKNAFWNKRYYSLSKTTSFKKED
ncbi:succinylglutamate desuccinylase/aspartoacylase family protein [uncultured Aquimarina sp.]|uniref:succinylglutamate desuccinylase/aspartoacylase domain-containing protein n=1 Tax=uncultured Aquimarina sp. TaxID=575652 RepID=UPI0026292FF2|nr:succinylglutamate desuccinylase/aspartoacylase family protein [uncultured Aquimarina sp.]